MRDEREALVALLETLDGPDWRRPSLRTRLGRPRRQRAPSAGRVRLRADGTDWQHGTGAEVRAAPDLVLLVLSGRPVEPHELAGPGAARLRPRMCG